LERLLEALEVRERTVYAVLGDRVRVALHHEALGLLADLVAAPLAPRDEELLLGREAVDGRLGTLALARDLVRLERELGAGEVADRLAQHELAVVVDFRLDEVALELVHHALAARLELLEVLRRPPVVEASLRVELRALVVEA